MDKVDPEMREHRNSEGELHREDGPAWEDKNGTKQWYWNGKLHRKNGPAIECPNGHKEWWINGLRHREDGPAAELSNGWKYYWLRDKWIAEEELWIRMIRKSYE